MTRITTHVLDTVRGTAAGGIRVSLESMDRGGAWTAAGAAVTDPDGRVREFVPAAAVGPGRHRLVFATGEYFAARGERAFFPEVWIGFEVAETDAHLHLPLLLSRFGFTAYRGT